MHKVYMYFMHRDGWFCQFLEEDLKTPLPKKLAVATQDKILELARRGSAALDAKEELEIDHAFQTGRGGIWLNLSEEQYEKLTRR
jgi:hypothetical protein